MLTILHKFLTKLKYDHEVIEGHMNLILYFFYIYLFTILERPFSFDKLLIYFTKNLIYFIHKIYF